MAVPAVAAIVEKAAEVIAEIMATIEAIRAAGERMPGVDGQVVMHMQKGKE